MKQTYKFLVRAGISLLLCVLMLVGLAPVASATESSVAPFDFSSVYPKNMPPVEGESRLLSNYLCAYEALYGDLFYDHALIEKSLPEDLLAAYAALGIKGIIFQAVLSDMPLSCTNTSITLTAITTSP